MSSHKAGSDISGELTDWLAKNWDPDSTVGEWWECLGASGWAVPAWPRDCHGLGLSNDEAAEVGRTIARFGALGAPGGLGLALAGPTILVYGDEDQKRRYLHDLVTGRTLWCQLFSEPSAGSDLAGLVTRAVHDGEQWRVNGQKVWTSQAHLADYGMLLARTNVDVPKHQGITYFVLDMRQPGVDVRPLREMTGRALFNEVFLTDAIVPDDAIIGPRDGGWPVALTTLGFERSAIGADGASVFNNPATPGTVAGDLERRVGDFAGATRGHHGAAVVELLETAGRTLIDVAQRNGAVENPALRQDLLRLYSLGEVARYTKLRQAAARAIGADLPGGPSIGKLTLSRIARLACTVGQQVLGPLGTLHDYSESEHPDLDGTVKALTEMALFSPAPSIYGGTDEIQKNIIGERVLGLAKEPVDDRSIPFRDRPR